MIQKINACSKKYSCYLVIIIMKSYDPTDDKRKHFDLANEWMDKVLYLYSVREQ